MVNDQHDPNEPQKVSFTVDSGLLFQLGEELVARPSLALAELVKNSYDADATEVTVSMRGIQKPGGCINVEDNGNGMTSEELRAGWMRIAAPGKRTQTYSRRFHRPLTGAKGVGRFAARRLGKNLLLHSVANVGEEGEGKEELEIKFNWAQDFPPGRELTGISLPVNHKDVSSSKSTGVELRISDTYDAWTEKDLRALLRDLASLQSPFPDLVRELEQCVREEHLVHAADQDPGFKFTLKVDDQPVATQVTSEVTDILLARAVAVLDGEVIEVEQVDEHGAVTKMARASYTLEFPRAKGQKMKLGTAPRNPSGGEESLR